MSHKLFRDLISKKKICNQCSGEFEISDSQFVGGTPVGPHAVAAFDLLERRRVDQDQPEGPVLAQQAADAIHLAGVAAQGSRRLRHQRSPGRVGGYGHAPLIGPRGREA